MGPNPPGCIVAGIASDVVGRSCNPDLGINFFARFKKSRIANHAFMVDMCVIFHEYERKRAGHMKNLQFPLIARAALQLHTRRALIERAED